MNQSQLKLNKWIKKGNIFGEHRAQLPVVDIYPDRYRIYYSTRNDEGKSIPMFIEVDKNDLKQIITPPTKVDIKLGNPGMFDWAGIMPTEIVSFWGVKYLYYIGWSLRKDVPYHNSVGLAVSVDDGITWKKYSLGPIFSTSYKEPGYIGTVGILLDNGAWQMWYLSCRSWENGEPIYDIKYAVSSNGIDWQPTNYTAISLEKNEGGISSARVKKIDGIYHMWFSVRDKEGYRDDINKSYRIKKAVSYDGNVWKRIDSIDLDISSQEWENFMVCYPYIIEDNNQRIMFYNGNNFGETGIGYAINE
jgi:hypothetical protein